MIDEKKTVLSVHNLFMAYGDLQVINGVSMEVRQGEGIVILGHSGSGKTTFLRCLNFLERAKEGTIRIGNCEVDHAAFPTAYMVKRAM